jgi:hypothetical protein
VSIAIASVAGQPVLEGAGWRSRLKSPVVRGALAMIIVHLGFRAWAVFGGWYQYDDFAFISRMLNQGLSPATAAEPYAGHIMPVPMYLSWLFQVISPYTWWLTASFMLLLQAVAAAGLLRLLLTLFGDRPGILAPMALHLFTIISVPISVWWAAGANQLPMQIVLFWGLDAHVRYLRSRRRRQALLAAAWVLGGFLFYEKVLLVIGAYGIITLCYFTAGSLKERLLQTWSRFRFGFIVYGVLALVYLSVYVKVALAFSPGRATEFPILPVAANIVLRGWLTGIFGGPLRWWYFTPEPAASAAPSDLLVAACGVALLLVLRELRRTRSHSMRALWLPAFFLASNVLLVVAGRASYVGAQIALDYRYQGELGAVTAIALGCALMAIVGAEQQPSTTARSELFDVPSRAGAATLAVAILGLVSSIQYVSHWHQGDLSKRYFGTLLREVHSLNRTTDLIDGTVPGQIMWAAGYPMNTHSHLLQQFDRLRFVTAATDSLSMIDLDGHITPVVIPPVRSAELQNSGPCAYRITTNAVRIPFDGPLAFGGWWVRIGYQSTVRTPVVVSVGGETHRVVLERGLHSLYLRADKVDFDAMVVSGLRSPGVMCTDDVTVGRPEPYQMEQP